MVGPDDLKAHAASSQDFYALLDVSPAASESDIRRAYRRAALKYHPDKISKPTPADVDKFHILQIGYDLLSDPAVRQLYDNAREARERKKRERDMMDGAKRKMREDLEARERAGTAAAKAGEQKGVKRSWMASVGDEDAEERLQREIERISEDGRRRRREAEERLMKEAEAEERRIQEEQEEARRAADRSSRRVDRSQEGGHNIPEIQRSVKVRWIREGPGLELDADRLSKLFASFGKVEATFMLKDKRQHVRDSVKKKTVATGVIVFCSVVGAHAAVMDSEKKRSQSLGHPNDDWSVIESVSWAGVDQPDIGRNTGESPASSGAGASPSPPPIQKPTFNFGRMKTPTFDNVGKQRGKVPTFSSFSPLVAPGSSTYEEVTLMRLKNAQREKERKALEEQLRKEDEAADAAEAATAAQTEVA